MELVHARLCQLVAADYRGRAYADSLTGGADAGAANLARAAAWDGLGLRLQNAFRGARQVVRSPDYELVRWYQLGLLKNCLGKGVKARSREVSALLALLSEGLAGRVENLVGVRHA